MLWIWPNICKPTTKSWEGRRYAPSIRNSGVVASTGRHRVQQGFAADGAAKSLQGSILFPSSGFGIVATEYSGAAFFLDEIGVCIGGFVLCFHTVHVDTVGVQTEENVGASNASISATISKICISSNFLSQSGPVLKGKLGLEMADYEKTQHGVCKLSGCGQGLLNTMEGLESKKWSQLFGRHVLEDRSLENNDGAFVKINTVALPDGIPERIVGFVRLSIEESRFRFVFLDGIGTVATPVVSRVASLAKIYA